MLRVIQVLMFSSPWQRCNLEPITKNGCSFLRISTRPSSSSSSSSSRVATATAAAAFQSSAVRSESRPDDASASASASVSTTSSSSQGLKKQGISFCQWCGAATKQAIPDGDDKIRTICTNCSKVSYQNPKMVVGCLVEHDDKILLCKRKIQPAYGLWTLPAGYLEIGESAAEGAMRETREEACADVEVVAPFAHLDIPLISQAYIIFRARLKKPQFSPGPESMDCQLFSLDDIPFDSLAFSSMLVTLKLYIEDLKTGKPKFHYGTIKKRAGTGPSDISEHTFIDHLRC